MSRADSFAFVAGGTVQAGGGVYLTRHADDELLAHCLAGDFTYILTSRQMGKSSLMIRTAERLAAAGAVPVIVDLTEFGAQTTAEQWYKGFLLAVQDHAGLSTSAAQWWAQQTEHSLAHKFTRYFREVVVKERTERIVIFVDEIDTTLRLDFTDDFFTAIRFLYQQRAAESALNRLSFVLIGVATPGDLIKDTMRTPFNIGHRIDLTDFTIDEALPLASHLAVPEPLRRSLIEWILRWTSGHPYLTLRAIRSLAESPPAEWSATRVDERIEELFLRTGGDSDSNLQFVRDMLTRKAFDREAVLRTYWNIRRGHEVVDKELDQVGTWLKLSGVVHRQQGLLRVRNPIYECVFDERWARDHLRLHVNWRRRLTTVAAVLLVLTVLVTIPLAFYAWRQKEEAQYQARQAELQRDDAIRQGRIAEETLNNRLRDLEEAQRVSARLKTSNPAAAAEIDSLVAQGQQEVQKDRAALTAAQTASPADAGRTAAANRPTPRPPKPPPADPAPPREAPALSPEQITIRRALGDYRAAYAARDIKALQRVQALTDAQQKAVAAQFAAGASVLGIDSEDIRLLPGGRRAVVNARVVRRVWVDGRLSRLERVEVFTFEKRRERWVIVSPPPAV
jgi:hypothetical protein